MLPYTTFIKDAEAQIKQHSDLEDELKQCRATIREVSRHKDELVEKAREKISPEEAKDLILARWRCILENTIQGYLDAHLRVFQQNLEHLFDKYTIPLTQILSERDAATAKLNAFLKELGYEG